MLSEGKSGWRNPPERERMLNEASNEKYGSMKCENSAKFSRSPFQEMECVLHDRIRKRREKGMKTSSYFVKITAKSIMKEDFTDKVDLFKASNGWFHRFRIRKQIKFRKKKSGKQNSGEDNIYKIIKVSHAH